MQTLTQVFYNKFCSCPKEFLMSEEGERLIHKAYDLICAKEGIEEGAYFIALFSFSLPFMN